ncbi:MAG: 50S ribosomal protein L13 [Candidatus Sungbacteria bacterium RIFCSPHIGHO2_02_FULL_49_12]|uniref:Large ribosomal subunit protein uL13 n=1 Tax=Candidatus Sungbacteria bacterium RIFCSPHIGHO2_02_FULL_49_12 TaxID=1802271 RepID=A0A1G2KQF9_9BACT|nr:MAG: 50S ribosomal protein L13 [Candidatus Sungbacteria bacterium RIFCSPHIGHO2_02_FULL_49_12]
MNEVQIDASGRILGRLATVVAKLLMGKGDAAFDYSKPGNMRVVVSHTDKLRVTGKKPLQKLYRRHSGFHGGLKETRYQDLFAKDSRRVLQAAVSGMLPKNKLRVVRLKQLVMYKDGVK